MLQLWFKPPSRPHAHSKTSLAWVQELIDALRTGVSLDELWKVARGEVKYADFLQGRQGQRAPSRSPSLRAAPRVPEELVSRKPNPSLEGCSADNTSITCP